MNRGSEPNKKLQALRLNGNKRDRSGGKLFRDPIPADYQTFGRKDLDGQSRSDSDIGGFNK